MPEKQTPVTLELVGITSDGLLHLRATSLYELQSKIKTDTCCSIAELMDCAKQLKSQLGVDIDLPSNLGVVAAREHIAVGSAYTTTTTTGRSSVLAKYPPLLLAAVAATPVILAVSASLLVPSNITTHQRITSSKLIATAVASSAALLGALGLTSSPSMRYNARQQQLTALLLPEDDEEAKQQALLVITDSAKALLESMTLTAQLESPATFRSYLQALFDQPLHADWPSRFGTLDLAEHDAPHSSCKIEWWYQNCHVTGKAGTQLSVFVCFFRIGLITDKGKLVHMHSMTWAISDPESGAYHFDVVLEKFAPKVILAIIKKTVAEGGRNMDKFLRRALVEVLEKDNLPLPDRMFGKSPTTSSPGHTLSLSYGEVGSLNTNGQGGYVVKAQCPHKGMAIDLTFQPTKAAVRHGNHGVMPGKKGDEMFYYFIPRCEVTGTVEYPIPEAEELMLELPREAPGGFKAATNPGNYREQEKRKQNKTETGVAVAGPSIQTKKVAVRGRGWYDHEFGGIIDDERNNNRNKNVRSNIVEPNPNEGLAGSDEGSSLDDEEENEEDTMQEEGNMFLNAATDAAVPIMKGGAINLDYAWNWVAVMLEDGTDISGALLYDLHGVLVDTTCVVVKPSGERVQLFQHNMTNNSADTSPSMIFEPVCENPDIDTWQSVRTFVTYPLRFKLLIPSLGIDLDIRASQPDQECLTLLSEPALWEGRCDVRGRIYNQHVTGLAFLERHGFSQHRGIRGFFKQVGNMVQHQVKQFYPDHPTYNQTLDLVAGDETKHYMEGVPCDVLAETLLAPVRYVADRGGKSWRSYGALACIDCVGGDSRRFAKWLCMPEFLHVGSLIIDDIQDKSETRRGGECSHLKYGEALCINAGTAAYFMAHKFINISHMSSDKVVKCYDLYFSALRGGHAGQALDIYGNDYMMDQVVANGDAGLLEQRILAIHRLKTGVPAGTLARMGALVGDGSPTQVEAMGIFFESVGVAFQIMDDVLNLRGLFSKDEDKLKKGTQLKRLGEDIVEGKVTMPVAKAMSVLKTAKERQELWNAVRAKPQEQAEVDRIIQLLESLGAIDLCVEQADVLVEQAWKVLDPVIPDSFSKVMLRAFGWFVIERCG